MVDLKSLFFDLVLSIFLCHLPRTAFRKPLRAANGPLPDPVDFFRTLVWMLHPILDDVIVGV